MEELRSKHKTIQSAAHHIALECIHPQSVHGSPYHVHPYPSPVRLQHAFQSQNSPKMFHPKGLKPHLDGRAYGTPTESPILGRALCLTPRGSPIPGRVSHLNEKFQDSLTLNSDTDALVAKISAMFPTVSETHIKILLKKYYNREAVVISALQVEKHPITTPGPLTMSPSAARLQRGAVGVYSALQLAKGVSGSMQGSSHYSPLTGSPHARTVRQCDVTACLQRGAVGVYSALQLAKGVSGSMQGSSHYSPLTGSPHARTVRQCDVTACLQRGAVGVYSALQLAKGVSGSMQGSSHYSPLTGSPHARTVRQCDVTACLQRGAVGVYSALQLAKGVSGSMQGSSHYSPLTGSPHARTVRQCDVTACLQRGAVGVYSALQLAKGVSGSMQGSSHYSPLTGSPHARTVRQCDVTACLQRGAVGVYSALQLAKGVSGSMQGSSHYSPLTGSPHGSPSLLRPASGASSYCGTYKSDGPPRHQSPKMKLKYLKSIFPKAEETLILDVLANKDNNVQKASEELITMGFTKKETIIKKKETPLPPKKVVTIMKTLEEKNQLKQKLEKKYSSIAERVISLALDSVDYNEERAEQILNAVVQEEEAPKVAKPPEVKETKRPPATEPKKGPILKSSTGSDSKYKSHYSLPTTGPNPSIRQGPKDSLLLMDYMPWNGPNPDFRGGQMVKVEGPEPALREKASSLARGPSGLAKGPGGLAKGSIYQKMSKKSAKMGSEADPSSSRSVPVPAVVELTEGDPRLAQRGSEADPSSSRSVPVPAVVELTEGDPRLAQRIG
ncbi:uncharacterized protein LOC135086990 [Ostrinia nubilalis]|uniref:uncharacterized protein LOC135086990 n=1 Tax=Ostrinia nubilalis TaxID=29057 RepID=UPI003082467D